MQNYAKLFKRIKIPSFTYVEKIVDEYFPVEIFSINPLTKNQTSDIFSAKTNTDVAAIQLAIYPKGNPELDISVRMAIEEKCLHISDKYNMDIEKVRECVMSRRADEVFFFSKNKKDKPTELLIAIAQNSNKGESAITMLPPLFYLCSEEPIEDRYLKSINHILSVINMSASLLAKELEGIASVANMEKIKTLFEPEASTSSSRLVENFVLEWLSAPNGGALVFLSSSYPIDFFNKLPLMIANGIEIPADTSFGFYNPIESSSSTFAYETGTDLRIFPGETYIEHDHHSIIKKTLEAINPIVKQMYSTTSISAYLKINDHVLLSVFESITPPMYIDFFSEMEEEDAMRFSESFEEVKNILIEMIKVHGSKEILEHYEETLHSIINVVTVKNLSTYIENYEEVAEFIYKLLSTLILQLKQQEVIK